MLPYEVMTLSPFFKTSPLANSCFPPPTLLQCEYNKDDGKNLEKYKVIGNSVNIRKEKQDFISSLL